ncbi:MAG: acyl-CoA dehydrogenase [Firmicutes bacterium]|nr:acyl-CoA dehydrogenase [Bacillota bacterium]MCL5038803.1 acyl-CoA dehydrogenase [Bacillota bacterium]
MDFGLTDEQRMVREMVRDLAEREIRPLAAELDEKKEFPWSIIWKMGELGLFGLPFPEECGGSGAGAISYALALEEIGAACASTGLTYEAAVSLGATPFYLFGTEAQKRHWLTPAARGEILIAFGLTEPNAGSDAGGTQTRAVLEGDHWVLNGSKIFITNASVASALIVTAVTDPEKGTRGISTIIIPKGTPGLTIGKKFDKLGLRASDTAQVFLEDCRVPKENLLGKRGEGFKQFLQVLDGGRVAIGALAVGIARASLDASLRYAGERVQFGQPINRFQAIQFKLADMATRIEQARLLVHKAAWLKEKGLPYTKEASMAKLAASETAVWAALEAIQIHGGYGYIKEYLVERYLRDAKLMEIGEGTSEVQRLVIARQLGCR